MKYITTIGDQQFTIDINRDDQVTVDDQVIDVNMQQMRDTTMYSVIINGQSYDVRMNERDGVYAAQLRGQVFEVIVEDEHTRRLAGLKSGFGVVVGEAVIKAPMPGVVVDILVSPGQTVAKGDIVVILESMKMQNEFKSPKAGKVHTLRVAVGDKVEQNAVLLTIA